MTYIICSNRHWHKGMPKELFARTGKEFHLIANKADLTLENLEYLKAEMIFLPHWSWIIPPEIFTTYECIIFHMTDVPYGRGGSPLQNLILRGHQSTFISALRCSYDVDGGDVYLKRPLSLWGTAQEIYLRASQTIADMTVEIVTEQPIPKPQIGEVIEFVRRKPADGDWSHVGSLETVYDYIRMLDADGYPPAFVEVGPFRLEFARASLRGESVVADVRITRRMNKE